MRAMLSLVVVVLSLASADALSSCEVASSDSRVIYGKSIQKGGSSLLMCRGISEFGSVGRSQARVPSIAESTAKPSSAGTTDSPEVRSERVAILMQELLRSRDHLNAHQRSGKGGSVDLAAVKRLESDIAALKNELKRLGRSTP